MGDSSRPTLFSTKSEVHEIIEMRDVRIVSIFFPLFIDHNHMHPCSPAITIEIQTRRATAIDSVSLEHHTMREMDKFSEQNLKHREESKR